MRNLFVVICTALLFACGTAAVDPNAPPLTEEQQKAADLAQQQRAVNIANLGVSLLNTYITLESDDWSDEKVEKYRFYMEELVIAIAVWQAYIDGESLADAHLQQLIVDGLLKTLEQNKRLDT